MTIKLLEKKFCHHQFQFTLIENQSQLDDFLNLIFNSNLVALDTEFERKNTYFPILSTIQIAVENSVKEKIIAIIDVLKGIDLSGLMAIIANPKIVKIIHSGIQDLQIFYFSYKTYPQNIFDTQIIANFCGFDHNISLYNLVKNQCGVELNKAMQASDWIKRPLSPLQINYALNDVLFLHDIYNNFNNILTAKQRVEWASEEMQDFIKNIFEKDIEHLIKKFSIRGLTKLQITKLYQILKLREEYAKSLNINRENFIKNDIIYQIVLKNSVDVDLNLLNNNFAKELQKILADDKIFLNLSEKIRFDDLQLAQYNKIKSIISKSAKHEMIAPQFLVNNDKLKQIVIKKNSKEILNNWRYFILGDKIQKIFEIKIKNT